MNGRQKQQSVFGQIKAGLEDSIAYSRGKLSLVTTEPPPPAPGTRRVGRPAAHRATGRREMP